MNPCLNSPRIAGIDPGLASGGLVAIDASDRDRVLAAFSIIPSAPRLRRQARTQAAQIAEIAGGWSDKQFLAACLRAQNWIARCETALDQIEADHGPIGAYAIESFTDQPSRSGKSKKKRGGDLISNRWQTPLVIGMLLDSLAQRGVTLTSGQVFLQNAGVVLPQKELEWTLIAEHPGEPDVVVPGSELISDEHTRSALMHALSLAERAREHQLLPSTEMEVMAHAS